MICVLYEELAELIKQIEIDLGIRKPDPPPMPWDVPPPGPPYEEPWLRDISGG